MASPYRTSAAVEADAIPNNIGTVVTHTPRERPRTWYDELQELPNDAVIRVTWAEWRASGFLAPGRKSFQAPPNFPYDCDPHRRVRHAYHDPFTLACYEVVEGIGIVVTYVTYGWKLVVVGPW